MLNLNTLCLAALGLLFMADIANAKTARTALVIGNSQYINDPLENPKNDAADLAESLRNRGFKVFLNIDINQREMEQAIDEFESSLQRRGGTGLFYYAGHGIQSEGINYLLPVDNSIEKERDLRYEAVNVGRVISAMEDAGNKLNIVILDACRNNPLARSFRSSTRGLARLEKTPSGLLIAYSTSPGDVAQDGEGRNSPYAASLIQAINTENQHILLAFQDVANQVQKKTKGVQVPWISSSLTSNFYFSQTNNSVIPTQPTARIPPSAFPTYSDPKHNAPTQNNLNNPNATKFNQPTDAKHQPTKKEAPQLPPIVETEMPYLMPASEFHWQQTQDTLQDHSLGPAMIAIPTGSFTMGSEENKQEKPPHPVAINHPISVSKYEVSFSDYDKYLASIEQSKNPDQWGRHNQPVINVSWQDANNYTQWLSEETGKKYRLPSESEWEYFTRAKTDSRYFWGDELPQCSAQTTSRIDKARSFGNNKIQLCAEKLKSKTQLQVNCRHCFSWISKGKTVPVNSYKANNFGLFNTLGNVAEYTLDCWRPNYYGASQDNAHYEKAGCEYRVVRGGHWNSSHDEIRSASRTSVSISSSSNTVGFRVVREDSSYAEHQ